MYAIRCIGITNYASLSHTGAAGGFWYWLKHVCSTWVILRSIILSLPFSQQDVVHGLISDCLYIRKYILPQMIAYNYSIQNFNLVCPPLNHVSLSLLGCRCYLELLETDILHTRQCAYSSKWGLLN